jgi:hypothetical protein
MAQDIHEPVGQGRETIESALQPDDIITVKSSKKGGEGNKPCHAGTVERFAIPGKVGVWVATELVNTYSKALRVEGN